MRILSRLVLVVPFVACTQDHSLNKTSDAFGAEGPDIEVTPMHLDFGALGAGEVATQTFTVSNVGASESTLEVSEITIGGEAGGFTILTEETSFSLPGGASEEIEVAFTPEGANDQIAEAIVVSDDEDEKRVTVDLLGEGLVPELEISPDPLNLGTAYIGCSKDHDVTLTNVGTDLLTIDSIAQSGGGGTFLLTDDNVLPLSLEPGDSTTVNIEFVPEVEGSYTGELSVRSNEPIGTRTAEQTAEGAYAGEYEDEFEVPVDPPADIIFFVDQSCSMDDDQRNLASNFSSFISQLSTYTSNWHVMVVNDDDGCNNSGILTSSSSDYEGRFTDAVSRGGGFWTEAGLYVTESAVRETDAGDCNDTFMRPTAILHIILVSDEPEQSGNSTGLVNRIISKKGDASLVRISAVAGDYPSGCSSGGNSAEYGSGYYEATTTTGGLFLSICSNWATSVEALADASVESSAFELTRTPAPSTITVAVNGTNRPSGWTYDSASNAIEFDAAHLPTEGDIITVNYAALASCD